MTSGSKKRSDKKKSTNGWVIAESSSQKKIGFGAKKTIKPQTLAEMLAYARPATQSGKHIKGFL